MTGASRGEAVCLAISAALFGAGLVLSARLGEALDLRASRLFLPAGLLSLAAVNVRLRSKALGWGIFALAFVLFMTVFGPWVLGLRVVPGAETLKFMRAMAMFLSLSLTGLFQLRAARGAGNFQREANHV